MGEAHGQRLDEESLIVHLRRSGEVALRELYGSAVRWTVLFPTTRRMGASRGLEGWISWGNCLRRKARVLRSKAFSSATSGWTEIRRGWP